MRKIGKRYGDGTALLAAGLACAAVAAAFWNLFGEAGWDVIATLFLLVAVADNRRLRKQLRRSGSKPDA